MEMVFSILVMIIYVALLIYILSLLIRLVRAVEEIANRSGLAARMLEVMLDKITSKSGDITPPA